MTTIDNSLLNKQDFQNIKKQKTNGSSFEEQKVQYGFLSSLTIHDIYLQDIGIGVQDLSFIRSPLFR